MKLLFVGESWIIHSTHIKGFDTFETTVYEEGGKCLQDAFESGGIEVDYMPSHVAAESFPDSAEKLAQYDVVVLSDIGSNTFLLSSNTFSKGQITPNRLKVMRDYVANGGGFAMMGGYMSFQGIDAKARFAGSPIEELLPVKLLTCDDRLEAPEGVTPTIELPNHPVLDGIPAAFPHFLGYNILTAKEDAQVLARCGEHVFMAAGRYGKGRSFAFASDIAPHWGSPEFVSWAYYNKLFVNIAEWLAGKR